MSKKNKQPTVQSLEGPTLPLWCSPLPTWVPSTLIAALTGKVKRSTQSWQSSKAASLSCPNAQAQLSWLLLYTFCHTSRSIEAMSLSACFGLVWWQKTGGVTKDTGSVFGRFLAGRETTSRWQEWAWRCMGWKDREHL